MQATTSTIVHRHTHSSGGDRASNIEQSLRPLGTASEAAAEETEEAAEATFMAGIYHVSSSGP